MTRVARGIGTLGMVLLVAFPSLAQAPPRTTEPPPMTNLQVWPKDTPRAQVLQTMNAFNESLGVECSYCHVAGDFASDEKREKRVARQMILLRDSINVMLPAVVGKPAGAGPTAGEGLPGAPVRVLCRSCHRGLPIPRQLADVVTEAAAGGGATAGLAKYDELRTRYYGGQEYDFGEASLLTIAARAMTAKRPDDAIRYLQTNLQHFPKSARTYVALAQARTARGDTQGAIKDLETAATLDPQNAQARRQLQQLKGQ
ncbi:MAG: photosynthetic reaction center cytochrome c subunit family protein [Vicinamibacterales bacterium]